MLEGAQREVWGGERQERPVERFELRKDDNSVSAQQPRSGEEIVSTNQHMQRHGGEKGNRGDCKVGLRSQVKGPC